MPLLRNGSDEGGRLRFWIWPVCLVVLAQVLDTLVTYQHADQESNRLLLFLWGLGLKWILPGLWLALYLQVVRLASGWYGRKIGLWFLITVGLAHLTGFLSWTPINVFSSMITPTTQPVFILVFAGVIGGAGYWMADRYVKTRTEED
ncbi:hypothetical protein KGQ71_02545 [Patescibacteria group bacterium]|nr:hypothetical protein [Patescibacteria group bacterium]